MNKPFLSLQNISYKYNDGTNALHNINLDIPLGKKIVLLGNNGAGKSTLFQLLNGILKPTSGSILVDGETLAYKRQQIKKLRQEVGIVFQDPETQLFSTSVLDDISFGPKNLGLSSQEREKAVENAIALTEVESIKHKPPHLLSIGQKKRVAIAGIVAMNPKLMVLDEPTAGLDPYYSRKLMSLLEIIHNENRTIILSTHNVDFAYEWADQIIILNDGKIISKGHPSDVFLDDTALSKSHLEKPWIMEVFEQLFPNTKTPYPRSKQDLYKIINELNQNNKNTMSIM